MKVFPIFLVSIFVSLVLRISNRISGLALKLVKALYNSNFIEREHFEFVISLFCLVYFTLSEQCLVLTCFNFLTAIKGEHFLDRNLI